VDATTSTNPVLRREQSHGRERATNEAFIRKAVPDRGEPGRVRMGEMFHRDGTFTDESIGSRTAAHPSSVGTVEIYAAASLRCIASCIASSASETLSSSSWRCRERIRAAPVAPGTIPPNRQADERAVLRRVSLKNRKISPPNAILRHGGPDSTGDIAEA